jgi:cytidine deaminase
MLKNKNIINFAIKKARTSACKFKISAIGFNAKGEIIGSSTNIMRFVRKGGGLHAEAKLIMRYRNNLDTILICRVNKTGEILPIEPCGNCLKLAEKYGIKIISVLT